MPLGLHLASFLRKTVPEIASKKVNSQHEDSHYLRLSGPIDVSGSSQRGRLACALLEKETKALDRVLCSKILCELVSIAIFSKLI